MSIIFVENHKIYKKRSIKNRTLLTFNKINFFSINSECRRHYFQDRDDAEVCGRDPGLPDQGGVRGVARPEVQPGEGQGDQVHAGDQLPGRAQGAVRSRGLRGHQCKWGAQ